MVEPKASKNETASLPSSQSSCFSDALERRQAARELSRVLGSDLPPRSLFERYRPPEHWFFRRDDIGGIHGIDHEARVLIWQELLARLLIKDGMLLDQEALRWAAATHDTQRHADGADIEHGERAAAWVKHRLSHLIPAGTLSLVAYLNTWHVPPDQFAPSPPPELAVFKDADSLDRVRLYDLDPAYLRCAPSQLLTPLAQALFEKSEEKRDQEGYPIFDCVLAAAVDLGLIIVREAEEMGTSTG